MTVNFIQQILDNIETTLTTKGGGYTENVIEKLPVDVWVNQILIKAMRAKYSGNIEKLKDELLDCANYCILVLSEIERSEHHK